MVKITKMYTRTGDDGTTGLVGGGRAAKDGPRVEAVGDLDELNSLLGAARTAASGDRDAALGARLAVIQNFLFDLGAEVATPPGGGWEGMRRATDADVAALERLIDDYAAGLPELRSFVLPGGTPLNAALHHARAVCRRAERRLVALSRSEPVSRPLLVAVNRLSDLLFAMARAASAGGHEYLWKPDTDWSEAQKT